MRIELDTNSLSERDVEVLRALDGEREAALAGAQRELLAARAEADGLRVQIAELEKRPVFSPPVLSPGGRRMGVTEEIMSFLRDPETSLSARELLEKMPGATYRSVMNALYRLCEQNVLDHTSKKPYSYFARATGDPELRAALPAGTKASVFR